MDETFWHDTIRLAGTCAEQGITRLTLTIEGRPTEILDARVTDLPRVLGQAPVGAELRASGQAWIRADSGWVPQTDIQTDSD